MIRITVPPSAFQKLDRLKASVHEVIFATHLDFDAALRDGTPVDTGYAVNSWQVLANGSPAPRDGFESESRGTSDLATILASVGGIATFANTAEYIGALAAGHSPQAPAGWIEAIANQYEDFLAHHVQMANARLR